MTEMSDRLERPASIEIANETLLRIGAIADTDRTEAYVVGGFVRDRILGKDATDVDIVVIGDGISFAKLVARELGIRDIVTYEAFGTAMLPYRGGKIEFVTAREESYSRESRKPSVKQASLESDLSRRDFTINAMAASINRGRLGAVVDPYNGYGDLVARLYG